MRERDTVLAFFYLLLCAVQVPLDVKKSTNLLAVYNTQGKLGISVLNFLL